MFHNAINAILTSRTDVFPEPQQSDNPQQNWVFFLIMQIQFYY